MQVLGSGGPEAIKSRASSSYLVWVDGRARILIDPGGGTFARFGASGARFEDLDLLALTHLHADHAAALPAFLKSGYFRSLHRSAGSRMDGPATAGVRPAAYRINNARHPGTVRNAARRRPTPKPVAKSTPGAPP